MATLSLFHAAGLRLVDASMTGITTTVAPWFERHQGRWITLAIMGASVGAIVGVPLLLLAIGELGLGRGLIAAGIVAVLLLGPLIAIVLRYRGPADLGLQRDGEAIQSDAPPKIHLAPIATPANRSLLLWSATVAFALGLTIQIGFITHHVALAEPLLGRAGAGMLVSAAGVTAFVGRLILARIVDRVDARRLGCFVMIAQAASLLAIAFWPIVPVLIVRKPHLWLRHRPCHDPGSGPGAPRVRRGGIWRHLRHRRHGDPAHLGLRAGTLLRPARWLGGYGPGFIIAAVVTMVGCASLFVGGG